MLARWAGLPAEALPPQAPEVIRECGNLALALAMIGAQLNGKPAAYWDIVLGYLRHADLAKIKARFPEPHTTLFRAIQVSFEALNDEDPVAARRYLALAVLLEDMAAAPAVQQTLWNVDEGEALETAERLVGLSLAQRDAASGGIRLHDLQLDYVRAQYPHPDALDLIHGAVRLSAHVIEKDPRQFAPQVLGRLLPYRSVAAIRQFIDEIAAGAPAPWLRPLEPALHPPGTPLLRTLEGHAGPVNGVAVTPDGQAGGFRVLGQHAEGVGPGDRPRAAHPGRSLWSCLWRGGDAGREAGGLRVSGQDAEGVGPGDRPRAAHAGRPLGCCRWRGGDAGREAGGFRVSGQHAEGVGPGDRPRAAHAGRPL